MTKPTVQKHDSAWRVYINGRMWSSNRTHAEAIERAHNIATYAHRIRFQRDLERIQNALARMESNART